MRAILISAGQGTRLIPLTLDMPKCLVPVGGTPILDWQLDALDKAGFEEVLIVGGYKASQITRHIAKRGSAGPATQMVYNPFWSVSSSIGSVWAARNWLDRPFCLMNGDVIFTPGLLADALARAGQGVNLVVERTDHPEHDDMQVQIEDGLVLHVGKELTLEADYHRSLGIILCGTDGHDDYGRALDQVIRRRNGPLCYHHDVIDHLAQTIEVRPVVTSGHDWLEIDRPDDIAFWLHEHVTPAAG